MAKRTGAVHVSTTRRHYKGKVYETTLLRRSYREGGKVRNETVGNLSHLPPEIIAAIRAMLAGRALVDLEAELSVESSRPHGHVAALLGTLRALDLERLISRQRCRERDLVVAMVCQRLLAPGSKLSSTRRFAQTTLAEELELGAVSEAELLAAMDWLLARQERIEGTLARRHLAGEGFALYDLSSSYLEGRCCPLAALGYSRDGVKGKPQITYGLTCSPEGRPVAIAVHEGNVADSQTLPAAVAALRERFGIEQLVFIGDRGMVTSAHAATLTAAGVAFVSALRAPQIRRLLAAGDLQMSLFDETGLAEIASPELPGERLVVCRNPALAASRARKREALLAATEAELAKVTAMVEGPRGRLRGPSTMAVTLASSASVAASSASRLRAREAARAGLRQTTRRSPDSSGEAISARPVSSKRLICRSPAASSLRICGARRALTNATPAAVSVAACALVTMPRSPMKTSCSIPKRSRSAATAAGSVCESATLPSCTAIATGRPSGEQITYGLTCSPEG